ncbi:MAG: hypothetical protein IE918_10070 [Campylobacterales bacterium]|nr:hypothetical protein [Campylobacterales bacterium]
MQKEWSSYRITAILYAIVLLMPVGFYFVHQAFQTLQQDTKVIRQSSWLAGSIGHHYLDPATCQISGEELESTLRDLSSWVRENNHSAYYIGEATLQKDFQRVEECWHGYSVSATKENNALPDQNLRCYESAETLALIIEKMVYLKQHQIVNIFYGTLFLTMLLLIAAIYFVRVYIHLQMKKHTIHDGETGLFNQKYLFSVLRNACAESKRYHTPLCALWISVAFDSAYASKTRLGFSINAYDQEESWERFIERGRSVLE